MYLDNEMRVLMIPGPFAEAGLGPLAEAPIPKDRYFGQVRFEATITPPAEDCTAERSRSSVWTRFGHKTSAKPGEPGRSDVTDHKTMGDPG
jgi:hypothetical protein